MGNWLCKYIYKQGRAHKRYSPMDPLIWPSKSRTTSSNLRIAALCGYGMYPRGPTRWTIGKNSERGSGISVLATWHDDDDDFFLCTGLRKFGKNLFRNCRKFSSRILLAINGHFQGLSSAVSNFCDIVCTCICKSVLPCVCVCVCVCVRVCVCVCVCVWQREICW